MVKERLRAKFRKRLRMVWKSDLTARNKAQATNMWASAIYRYFMPLWHWTRRDTMELDRTIRRVMRRSHFSASLDRVHLPRSRGGRGITSLEDMYEKVTVSAAHYLFGKTDPQMVAVRKHQLRLK